MRRVPTRLRDGSAMLPPLLVGATLAVVWSLLPAEGAGRRWLGIGVVVAVLAGALPAWWRLAPANRRALAPVVGGLLAWATTDLGIRLWALTVGPAPLTASWWTLGYPLGSALLAVGLFRLLRHGPEEQRAATVDAAIATTSLGLVLWVTIADPALPVLGEDAVTRTVIALFVLANLSLLAAVLRLLLAGAGHRTVCGALLGAAALSGIVTVLVAVGVSLNAADPVRAVTPLWLTVYLLLGTALRHPGVAELPHELGSTSARATRIRLTVLALAVLLVPVLQLRVARTSVDLLIAAGTAVLLLLGLGRVGQLLTAQAKARELAHTAELAALSARQARRFQALVRHTSDVLVVLDADTRVAYATPSAGELLGADPVGLTARDLAGLLHPEAGRETVRALRSRLTSGDARPVTVSARLRDRDGRPSYVEVVAVDLRADPDVRGIVLTLQETTQRRELEQELAFLAFHDPLTELCNRQLFQDRLEHALARAWRAGEQLAVLLCDLDDFREVNDAAGHDVGDALLKVIAERLEAGTRTADTVARLGGDEFAILLEPLDEPRTAIELAERLQAAIATPMELADQTVTITGSFGIAIDDGSRTGGELLRDADIAVYMAKADPRRAWSLHRSTMTDDAKARRALTADLTAAIVAEELKVVFQPIVRLAPLQIVGVESLARWTHPEHGRVPPERFIALAEHSGHIVGLGELVLSRALAALRRWLEDGADPRLHATVNVSALQLHQPTYAQRLAELLEQYGVAPHALVLELTESVLLRDDEALATLRHVRELGVRIAVDDFGTGYSSLAYLRQLPVDLLKIDRSFIRDLGTATQADELARAIIDLGRRLDLDVVAEGVETARQAAALQALGCPYAQGYRFARPLPRRELTRLLRDGLDAELAVRPSLSA